jgi:hypothetical protein
VRSLVRIQYRPPPLPSTRATTSVNGPDDPGSTFRIVEACLDRWTLAMLDEEIRRPEFGPDWVHARGWVIERVVSHDVYHTAELIEALGGTGLRQVDLWG